MKSINYSKVNLKSKLNKKLQEDDIDHLKTLIGWSFTLMNNILLSELFIGMVGLDF